MTDTDNSLVVHTDRIEYFSGDNVTVTIFVKADGQPAPQEEVRLYVFRPDGKRVHRSILFTDNFGIAIGVYRLQKKDYPGSYYIEAKWRDRNMALSSFLVLKYEPPRL